jgi:uncharacterized membrane protein YeiB
LPLAPSLWLVAAAVLALGGLISLIFVRRLRYGPLPLAWGQAR